MHGSWITLAGIIIYHLEVYVKNKKRYFEYKINEITFITKRGRRLTE